jgi:hypothetical protein
MGCVCGAEKLAASPLRSQYYGSQPAVVPLMGHTPRCLRLESRSLTGRDTIPGAGIVAFEACQVHDTMFAVISTVAGLVSLYASHSTET